jgi:hypothetical protein
MKTTLMTVLWSAALLVSGCATSHSHSATWEYKVLEGYAPSGIEKELNKLGGDGWVVVSSTATAESPNPPRVLVILKRHK